MSNASQEKPKDVSSQVFEAFLANLTEAKVSEEVIDRLRKTLVENKTLTDAVLRKAVLGDL